MINKDHRALLVAYLWAIWSIWEFFLSCRIRPVDIPPKLQFYFDLFGSFGCPWIRFEKDHWRHSISRLCVSWCHKWQPDSNLLAMHSYSLQESQSRVRWAAQIWYRCTHWSYLWKEGNGTRLGFRWQVYCQVLSESLSNSSPRFCDLCLQTHKHVCQASKHLLCTAHFVAMILPPRSPFSHCSARRNSYVPLQ